MYQLIIATALLFLALLPLLMVVANLAEFKRAPTTGKEEQQISTSVQISVLIPARNEERSIGQALESIVKQSGVKTEVLVLNDHSIDILPKSYAPSPVVTLRSTCLNRWIFRRMEWQAARLLAVS